VHFCIRYILLHNDPFTNSSKSRFRKLTDKTVRGYRSWLFDCVAPGVRAMCAMQNGNSRYGSFKALGTQKQGEALLALYELFIKSKGSPEELELMKLAHTYYDTLLRAEGLSTDKICCPTDQSYFLAALLPDGRIRAANFVTHYCASSQTGYRCILLHHGRITSEGHDEFLPIDAEVTELGIQKMISELEDDEDDEAISEDDGEAQSEADDCDDVDEEIEFEEESDLQLLSDSEDEDDGKMAGDSVGKIAVVGPY
jgi:hypothetical protein